VQERARSPHDFREFETLYVCVCSFTFRFTNIQQLEACLLYYGQKTRPTSKLPYRELRPFIEQGLRGWEIERWFERLPIHLLEEPKRQKVVKALTSALRRWKMQKNIIGQSTC